MPAIEAVVQRSINKVKSLYGEIGEYNVKQEMKSSESSESYVLKNKFS